MNKYAYVQYNKTPCAYVQIIDVNNLQPNVANYLSLHSSTLHMQTTFSTQNAEWFSFYALLCNLHLYFLRHTHNPPKISHCEWTYAVLGLYMMKNFNLSTVLPNHWNLRFGCVHFCKFWFYYPSFHAILEMTHFLRFWDSLLPYNGAWKNMEKEN